MLILRIAFHPSDLDGDEAARRGYRRISNKRRLVSRIDRPDWLAQLAKKVGRSVAELYDPATGAPAAHWCDHYRRTLSKDALQLTEAAFRLVPQSSRDATGYVDPATLVAAPEPHQQPVAADLVALELFRRRARMGGLSGVITLPANILDRLLNDSEALERLYHRHNGDRPPEELARDALVFWGHPRHNLIETHVARVAAALQAERVRTCCRCADQERTQVHLAAERDEARLLVQQLVRPAGVPTWPEVVALAQTVLAEGPSNLPRLVSQATAERDEAREERDLAQEERDEARTERNEAQNLVRRLVDAVPGQSWLEVAAYARVAKTVPEVEYTLAKAHRCQDEIMRDRDWYEAHLENLGRDHAVATKGWRLRETKLMTDGARADELAKERSKSVLLEVYGALETLLRNEQVDRFVKGHHAWQRLHTYLAPAVPLPEFQVPSGKLEARQDLVAARERVKSTLLERDHLRDALVKLQRWFNPGELALKEIWAALEYRPGAVTAPPKHAGPISISAADLEAGLAADLSRVSSKVPKDFSNFKELPGHSLVAEWKAEPDDSWRADLLHDVALRMWRDRDGWYRSSILLAQRGEPGLAQLEAERVARAASLLHVDPLYALRQAKAALLKMPEQGGGILSGTDRGLLLARIDAALAGR